MFHLSFGSPLHGAGAAVLWSLPAPHGVLASGAPRFMIARGIALVVGSLVVRVARTWGRLVPEALLRLHFGPFRHWDTVRRLLRHKLVADEEQEKPRPQGP